MDVPVQQLPRGRHGLAREEVLASQRSRLLHAVVSAIAEQGYAKATVGSIVRRAGVSRETFYEHFAAKEECFLAAVDEEVRQIERLARVAVEVEGEPLARLDRFLREYLQRLQDVPSRSQACLTQVGHAGEAGARREVETRQQLIDVVAAVLRSDDAFACEFFVTGFARLAARRLTGADPGAVVALREPLLDVARRLFRL